MFKKQDRQYFYTKKVLVLCVFLFFSLAGPESQEGIREDSQQPEETRREEQGEISRRIYILNRYSKINPSLRELEKLYEALNVGNREALVKEYQVFQLKGNDGGYEQKLSVSSDYLSISENVKRVRRIQERLETVKDCLICLQMFTDKEGGGQVLVSRCNDEVPHILHYNCYLMLKDKRTCPYCQECLLDPRVEERLRNQLKTEIITTEVLKTGNINHLKNKIDDGPSHWVLHRRNTARDEEITSKTGIAAEEWLIVDEPVSESMEVLETNVDNPKDLEKCHANILEEFKFKMIKFNSDQEAREIFLVVSEGYKGLQIQHKESVVFDEKKDGFDDYPREVTISNISSKRKTTIHTRKKRGSFCDKSIVFNKENIEYLKETKSLFVFGDNIVDFYIGLEGDEIFSKEDIEETLITNDHVGLLCDNVNNFSVIKTNCYSLLSPINQLKISQIKDMKNNPKLLIEKRYVILKEEDCFLIPLFDFSAKTKDLIFRITRQMIERESFPFKRVLKELKELFIGVEIRGERLAMYFKDYAVILLFYFGENALKVKKLDIYISEKMGNCELDIIKDLIKNQPISKQEVSEFVLEEGLFDFAVETKIMESIKQENLYLPTDGGAE